MTQILEEEYDLPNHELFLTVFIGEPGTSAQALGPDGVDAALSLVDSFVGGLQSYLDETRMSEVTNLLVTSTPGYLPVSADRVLGLKRNINADFKKTGNSPIYQFEANGSGGN